MASSHDVYLQMLCSPYFSNVAAEAGEAEALGGVEAGTAEGERRRTMKRVSEGGKARGGEGIGKLRIGDSESEIL